MKRHRRYLILFLALATILIGCGGLVSPSAHRIEDYTPVFAAAAGGDLAAVQIAVDKDPTLVSATEWGKATLLHDAVGQNYQDVATFLLDKGADVNAITSDGITALHMAAQNG